MDKITSCNALTDMQDNLIVITDVSRTKGSLCVIFIYVECSARGRYQGMGQVITPHSICGM